MSRRRVNVPRASQRVRGGQAAEPAGTLGQAAEGWRGYALLALLVTAAVLLASTAVAQKSVTVDEYQALPHGLAIWKTGDFHLATAVPALPSLLAAAPLLASSARLDPEPMAGYTSSWQIGSQFLRQNIIDYHRQFLAGRLVSVLVLAGTCLLSVGLARRMYGAAGGLLAAAFACLSPNLLAHGALVTPDIYLAAAIVAAIWAFEMLDCRPGLPAACRLGLALGLAALCKLTGLLLFAVFPVLLAGFHLADRASARRARPPEPLEPPTTTWSARWRAMAAALVIGLATIHAGYLFNGSLARLDSFDFQSELLRTAAAAAPPWLPLGLPAPVVEGIDAQLAEGGYVAYLNGRFNHTGFWHYYLVALAVKVPLAVPLLCLAAWFFQPRLTRFEVRLLVTAGILLAFFSLSRHKNIGVRYVLFLEPLAAVWIGRLAQRFAGFAPRGALDRSGRKGRRGAPAPGTGRRELAIVSVATVWMLATALLTWPNYLAYFNLASGGPARGHTWLLDSNLDWGQDLIALRGYMEEQGIDSIDLAYFGRVPPEIYGIRYQTLGGPNPQRHAAISANLLWGRMYFVNGSSDWPEDPDTYAAFRKLPAKAVVGHSIYVFDLADVPAGAAGLR